jgi:HK97 family phage major capsid protein
VNPEIQKMHAKRADLEKQVGEVLNRADENGKLASDGESQYDRLIEASTSLQAQIERLERQAKVSKEFDSLIEDSIEDAGNAGNQWTEAEEDLAICAWLGTMCVDSSMPDFSPSVDQVKAMKKFGLKPGETFEAKLRRDFRNDVDSATAGNQAGNVMNTRIVKSLEEAMLHYGGMLNVAEVLRTAKANSLIWPTFDDVANSGSYVSEAAAVGSATDLYFDQTTWSAHKTTTGVLKVSHEALRDADVNLAALIGKAFGTRLGRFINTEATAGTTGGKVVGILTGAVDSGTTHAVNTIGFNDIIDLIYSVDIALRPGSRLMFHDSTTKILRKVKDSDGQYIWQQSVRAGEPDTILGYPVQVNNDMPDASATTQKTILFGDLSAYKIRQVETFRIKRLRELYAENDQEGFVAFNEWDGKLLNPAAAAASAPVKYLSVT